MASPRTALNRIYASAFQQIRSYSAPADRAIPAAKQKYVPTSGTYPKGFQLGTSHAGVKASNTKYDDIAMIISEKPCVAGAVFTRNIFRAAPISVSRNVLAHHGNNHIRGVIVNSGCANAVTGGLGHQHAMEMANATDECFDEVSDSPRTIVMSTGVIGQQLPIDRIVGAIPKAHAALGSSHEHWLKAANAICTTDTFPKLMSRTFTLPSHPETEYKIAGMTKGAGMIHPNMATLLGTICTDANVDPDSITPYLRHATEKSFNCISVDGDTSTNDTIALLANGAAAPAGTEPLVHWEKGGDTRPDDRWKDHLAFKAVLRDFMTDLAKLVVRDGEGATKFVTIRVRSDCGWKTAKRVATSIATSSLVKTALYGKDANWGRILCAIGYAPGIMDRQELRNLNHFDSLMPLQVVPRRVSVWFIPTDGSEVLQLLKRGEPEVVDEARAKEILEMEDLEILVRLEDGPPPEEEHNKGSKVLTRREGKYGQFMAKDLQQKKKRHVAQEAFFWTCDFSHEYVTINGDYRT